jgi:futalosine hydrolase
VADLILIPTEFERRTLLHWLAAFDARWRVQTIGFGVVAAAVEASRLIHEYQPQHVILTGIAGLYQGSEAGPFKLGQAVWFGSVAIDGIGVGQGECFRDAAGLGWQPRGDTSIELTTPGGDPGPQLLTVCSGSANEQEATWRRKRFLDAVGEDMEGYAVARCCRTAGVELSIIRGFSNLVGDREHSQWHVDSALASVAESLDQFLPRIS